MKPVFGQRFIFNLPTDLMDWCLKQAGKLKISVAEVIRRLIKEKKDG